MFPSLANKRWNSRNEDRSCRTAIMMLDMQINAAGAEAGCALIQETLDFVARINGVRVMDLVAKGDEGNKILSLQPNIHDGQSITRKMSRDSSKMKGEPAQVLFQRFYPIDHWPP